MTATAIFWLMIVSSRIVAGRVVLNCFTVSRSADYDGWVDDTAKKPLAKAGGLVFPGSDDDDTERLIVVIVIVVILILLVFFILFILFVLLVLLVAVFIFLVITGSVPVRI